MADNVDVLDGTGVHQTMRTRFDGIGQLPLHLPYSTDGLDYSANPQSLAGLVLLATIAENELRGGYYIQSQDVGELYIRMDDGAGILASTIIILDGAGATGQQGGSLNMDGMPHMGRIRIYAAGAGYQMAARVW